MKMILPLFAIGVLAGVALAQVPAGSPKADRAFAAATIKPSDPNVPGYGVRITPGQFLATGYTLRLLIIYAYDLHRTQISGGPAWLDSDKYNIVAKPDGEGQPTAPQWKIMLQKLLADRFGLTFHRQERTLSVYALTVAKGGPKMTAVEGDSAEAVGDISFSALGKLQARHASMADLTHSLQRNVLDRPVVDQTGLSGRYDFLLDWVPDEFQFAEVRTPGGPQIPGNTEGADLVTAVQQQLGLKLEATRAPAEVIVIDHADRPSDN
jgi:uncharacterized protein (TIGR03435 family)